MQISSHFIKQLRDRLKISEVISKKVKLIPKGKEFLGLCPFHQEKTPSFTVNDQKSFYHCFGCGAHGDLIGFVMEYYKMQFHEAVEIVAKEAGIPVPKDHLIADDQIKREKKLLNILEEVVAYYQKQLKQNFQISRYLTERGLSAAIIDKFRLGFAKPGVEIVEQLSKKYSKNELESSGAFKIYNNKVVQLLSGRIIFPIFNPQGSVIALGGRSVDGKQPKYLNSPETPIFKKRSSIYALNFAKNESYKTGEIIVTEGYMDVIALHNAGIGSAVATLGTAVSADHLKMLWKIVDDPIFSMDGDLAGRKSAIRVSEIALQNLTVGKTASFVTLPDGMDPDDILKQGGRESYKKCLEDRLPLSEFVWRNKIKGLKQPLSPEKKAFFESEIQKITDSISDNVVRKTYKEFFREKLWSLTSYKNSNNIRSANNLALKFKGLPLVARYELLLILMVKEYPELLRDDNIVKFLEDYSSKEIMLEPIFTKLYDLAVKSSEIDDNIIIEKLQEEVKSNNISHLLKETSYFLEKIDIKSYIDCNKKWFLVVQFIHLESLKLEYRNLLKVMKDDSYVKAMNIKDKISELEAQIKTKHIL